MHRLSAWSRPFAALFALWFAAILGDPGVLHSCPMHGAHSVHASATSAQPTHDMHGGASTHHASHGDSHQQTPTGPCSCVGHCSATNAVASVPAVARFTVPVHVALPKVQPEFPEDGIPASPDLRIPFANGPPQV
ncbi:MAG: hypothetical protein ABI664_21795 [bacterium]